MLYFTVVGGYQDSGTTFCRHLQDGTEDGSNMLLRNGLLPFTKLQGGYSQENKIYIFTDIKS
jgi:hypothetical protein